MVHIKLATIKRQLQEKMNYPEEVDPWGEYLCLDEAFEALLFGFQQYLTRKHLGAISTVSEAKKRGWMTEKVADAFTEYCIPGWRIA